MAGVLVSVCAAGAFGQQGGAVASKEGEAAATVYTPSAEQRAALLQQVRAEDKEKADKKAKSPVLAIVDNGAAKVTIVAKAADKRAAQMLQEWVNLMSGAELPIQEKAVSGTPSIFVGQAAVDAGCKVDGIKSRSNEGIRVKCDGKNVYISSQSPDAAERAVGRFLEEEFGCRWFADPAWGRHYPQSSSLSVAVGDFTEKPGFLYRRIWGAEGAFGNQNWKGWNGNGGRDIPMGHSWGFLSDKDFEEHPEWFRLDENGKRVKGGWYNIGHPEVRKRFHEWAMKATEASPGGISFSPPDDHREDFSPESMAYDNPDVIDPSSGRVSMTDRFMTIVNETALKTYAKYPDSINGFYAYSDYTLPPTKPELQKLSPNLSIWIAPIRFGRYHPLNHPNAPSQQQLHEIVKGWTDRASMIGWRTYNYNLAEVMTPYSRISILAYDLPYLYKLGCVGISLESFNSWELYAPHLYLSIRLSYDPGLDPWKIMADYWDKAYGPAAEAMEEHWMSIDAAFLGMKTESGSYHALHHVYTPEHLAKLERLIKKAEKDVARGTDQQKRRVSVARRGLTRAGYWRKWYDLINAGKVREASDHVKVWGDFVAESQRMGQANKYDSDYLGRFIAGNVKTALNAVNPEGTEPRKVIAVLPDEWKSATGDELAADAKPWLADLDDSGWKTIKTFSDTRNAQGLPEYFGQMWHRVRWTPPKSSPNLMLHFYKADRKVTLYINGEQVGEAAREGFRGVTFDLEGKLKPGVENVIAVNIEHMPLPELFLGGLCGPVYLIEK